MLEIKVICILWVCAMSDLISYVSNLLCVGCSHCCWNRCCPWWCLSWGFCPVWIHFKPGKVKTQRNRPASSHPNVLRQLSNNSLMDLSTLSNNGFDSLQTVMAAWCGLWYHVIPNWQAAGDGDPLLVCRWMWACFHVCAASIYIILWFYGYPYYNDYEIIM